MLKVVRYDSGCKEQWNDLVGESRNGTILHNRNYMDYHSHRFSDCSFVVLKKNKLSALIPGNISESSWYSHQGLTYGGLVVAENVTAQDVLEVFDQLWSRLRELGVKRITYKPIPSLYHRVPSDEDLYALTRLNARLCGRKLSSTIYQQHKISFIESRKSGIRKAQKSGVTIKRTDSWGEYWRILSDMLQATHATTPLHSLEEMTYLSKQFPNDIVLFGAYVQEVLVGGVVLFIANSRAAHVQYIASSLKGKATGALDLLFDHVVNQEFKDVPVFDFGTSMMSDGVMLAESLIFQKEGLGGRGTVYDTYCADL
jgi:hypothetical protein